MQNKIMFNGVEIVQPTEYTPKLATTSTKDSARDMRLVMRNTPIGTVEAYSLKWDTIPVSDAALILKQIINRSQYEVHYLDAYTGMWEDDEFYTSNISLSAKTLKDGKECWKELSLQMTRITPV